MQNYKIVSADSHLNEPPDLFKGVPQSLRQLAPQLIKTEKGDAWILAPGGGAQVHRYERSRGPQEGGVSVQTGDLRYDAPRFVRAWASP